MYPLNETNRNLKHTMEYYFTYGSTHVFGLARQGRLDCVKPSAGAQLARWAKRIAAIVVTVILFAGTASAQTAGSYLRRTENTIRYIDPNEAQPIDSASANEWQQHWYIKTNAAAWALVMTNIGGEIDVAKHWSVNLALYYSAWNYFTYKVKFRTFTIQPEVRYWFAEQNDGWFVNAHLGLGWFNFATGGEYRIQDHDRRTPAFGGGFGGGYRLLLPNHWKVEFSVGLGVYAVNYDKFINEPNGKLVENVKKAYFGLDQINISFGYTFDVKQKGGKR